MPLRDRGKPHRATRFGRKQLFAYEESFKELDKLGDAAILQLQSGKEEIEETGEISQESKQRICAQTPGFGQLWDADDKDARERPAEVAFLDEGFSKEFQKLSPQMRSSVIAWHNIVVAISTLERLRRQRWNDVFTIVDGQYAVPDREALDRLLRYETATERSLTRALDRLD